MRKEYSFESPELVLILTADKKNLFLEDLFQKGLNQLSTPHTALSIVVEKKYLGRMKTAVKLMDVAGVYLTQELRKKPGQKDLGKNEHAVYAKKNYDFLANTIAKHIKKWTSEVIDTAKLRSSIMRCHVK